MRKIEAPIYCPECDAKLEYRKDQLYCTNPHCIVRTQKLVEHFAKTLKIKGLGPATIEKLQLESIIDIYELTKDSLESILGEKIASKLLTEIEESKNSTMEEVLPAFGIPLIGKTAAKKLSPHIKSISDINQETVRKAGLGPIASSNILNWVENQYPAYSHIPFVLSQTTERVVEASKGVVCITGKVLSFKTKAEAYKELEQAGYAISDSLTKSVTILVNESGKESTKTQKARDSGVTIQIDLRKLLND